MQHWETELSRIVEKNPIVVLRFESHEWSALKDSRQGVRKFTAAYIHQSLDNISRNTPCLICGREESHPEWPVPPGQSTEASKERYLYLGIISSIKAVTTLESGVKVRMATPVHPDTESGLLELPSNQRYANDFKKRMSESSPVVRLSPKLSSHLVERLASIKENHATLRSIAESLGKKSQYSGPVSLQEDAVRTALQAFGIGSDDQASSLELVKDRETALARVTILEDAVIEHDARKIPGYDLIGSDLTGRAVFRRGDQQLEVYAANKRTLENVLGVDLIYFNATGKNTVMLQYKMLERQKKTSGIDWVYRPDKQFDKEILRMKAFVTESHQDTSEYRLNPSIFYLKFVKRDVELGKTPIILPIDHFEMLRHDPKYRGPRNGLIVSYEALSGRYLRQKPFIDLVSAGYVGSYSEDSKNMKVLVDAVLKGDRSVVTAIQKMQTSA